VPRSTGPEPRRGARAVLRRLLSGSISERWSPTTTDVGRCLPNGGITPSAGLVLQATIPWLYVSNFKSQYVTSSHRRQGKRHCLDSRRRRRLRAGVFPAFRHRAASWSYALRDGRRSRTRAPQSLFNADSTRAATPTPSRAFQLRSDHALENDPARAGFRGAPPSARLRASPRDGLSSAGWNFAP